jgi:hypothetical protein
MIQSPVAGTAVTVGLVTTVQPTTDRITLSGITSIFAGDILKIDDEIMRVATVGVGTTNVLIVNRPWMGTGLATHFSGALVTKLSGDYNIVDNQINFVSAPYGAYPISTTTDGPDDRDWAGLSTYSTFSDISEEFNGITTSFRLKSNRNDVTEIALDNAIVLIRDIYQGPRRTDGTVLINGDYELVEGSGITTAIFQSVDLGVKYDNNTNVIPRGGMIVSVGSTQSRGYQPLVSAGATATINGFGAILVLLLPLMDIL